MIEHEVKIVNVATGEEIVRNATSAEIAQMSIDAEDEQAQRQSVIVKANAKAALLERLGITADEAALLLS